MRIAFLTHQWPGARMGGIGSAVRQTAKAMAAAGHDVHVFTLALPDDVRADLPANVIIHESPSLALRVNNNTLPAEFAATISAAGEGIYRLATGWLLCADLLAQHALIPFDVVETPEVEALGLPLMVQPDFSAAVITHLHCCSAIAHQSNNVNITEDERLIHALEFAAIALADGRCAPTARVVEKTRDFMAVANDVAIIPHPVVISAGNGSTSHFTDAPVVAPKPILFFGRIEYLKGVDLIARALNLFLPDNPTATFRFAGPDTNTAPGGGSMIHHLKQLIDPALLARITFTGEVNHHQITRELNDCAFCVLPSRWENFSMACCQAMAQKRALIVGAGTGSVEVIGDAGLIAADNDPADLARHMQHLFRDQSFRDTLAQRGHERARQLFSPAGVAQMRADYYARVIQYKKTAHQHDRTDRIGQLPPISQAALLRALVMLTGTLSQSVQPVSPGARLLAIMETLRQPNGQPAQIMLFGAGKHTTRLLAEKSLWEKRGHRIVGIIDDHPRFQQHAYFLDLPVYCTTQAIQQASPDSPPIVLSTDTYEDLFWQQTKPLRHKGARVFRLYSQSFASG